MIETLSTAAQPAVAAARSVRAPVTFHYTQSDSFVALLQARLLIRPGDSLLALIR